MDFIPVTAWARKFGYSTRQARRIAASLQAAGLSERRNGPGRWTPDRWTWMIAQSYKPARPPMEAPGGESVAAAEPNTAIVFKTAEEWGAWAKAAGLKGFRGRRAAMRLSAIATGRGKILQEWREALEQGREKGRNVDAITESFVLHLAKTGRGISRSSLYVWWRNYQLGGIEALVDERVLAMTKAEAAGTVETTTSKAARSASLAKALQDAGVRDWEFTIDGVTVRAGNVRQCQDRVEGVEGGSNPLR